MTHEPLNDNSSHKKSKNIRSFLGVIFIFAVLWLIIRPGVFTIQPIGVLPEGITFIYHSRNSAIPFFSSPDGLCLKFQGSVTLLCRMAMLSVMDDLSDRILLRFPYSHWAYLMSTGGLQFEK